MVYVNVHLVIGINEATHGTIEPRCKLYLVRDAYQGIPAEKNETGISGPTVKDCIRDLMHRLAPTRAAAQAADETDGTTYP